MAIQLLDRLIGEDITLSIKVGAEASQTNDDVIVVRGISSEVDRVVKDMRQIVEDAKNDEIVNSYVRMVYRGRMNIYSSFIFSRPNLRLIRSMLAVSLVLKV